MKNPSVQGMDGRKTGKPTYAAIIGRFHRYALASRLPPREEGFAAVRNHGSRHTPKGGSKRTYYHPFGKLEFENHDFISGYCPT